MKMRARAQGKKALNGGPCVRERSVRMQLRTGNYVFERADTKVCVYGFAPEMR